MKNEKAEKKNALSIPKKKKIYFFFSQLKGALSDLLASLRPSGQAVHPLPSPHFPLAHRSEEHSRQERAPAVEAPNPPSLLPPPP